MRNGMPYPYLVGMHTATVDKPADPNFPRFMAECEGKAEKVSLDLIRTLSPLRLAELAEGAALTLRYHSGNADAGSSTDMGIVENDLLVIRLILSELARRAEVRS